MYFYIAAAPHCQAPFISPAPLPLSTPLAPLSRRHAYLLTYPHKHAYDDDDDDDAIPQFMYVLRLTPLLAGAALVGRAGTLQEKICESIAELLLQRLRHSLG